MVIKLTITPAVGTGKFINKYALILDDNAAVVINSESYDEEKKEEKSLTVNLLTTLSKESIEDGDHTLKIIAKSKDTSILLDSKAFELAFKTEDNLLVVEDEQEEDPNEGGEEELNPQEG